MEAWGRVIFWIQGDQVFKVHHGLFSILLCQAHLAFA